MMARMNMLAAAKSAGATDAQLDEPASARMLLKHLDLLGNAIRDLRARMDEIETKSTRFRGVFQAAEDYARGDLATHAGSLWHCNRATRDRPGDGSASWTLAVKSGRSAR